MEQNISRLHSDDLGSDFDSGQWWADRTGLRLVDSGTDRNEDASSFGLPPRVDDRAPFLTDMGVVPLPRIRTDRLTDGTEQSQRRQVV